MSWFRSIGESDSDSDHDSSKSEASEEEVEVRESQPQGRSKWLRNDDDKDKDEGKNKDKVLSGKDKREQEITSTLQAIQNAVSIQDYNAVYENFDKCVKIVVGKFKDPPKNFQKAVCVLDQFLDNQSKDQRMKNNAQLQRSYKLLKGKVKKVKETYETDIQKFRETWDPADDDLCVKEDLSDQEESDEDEPQEEDISKPKEKELTPQDVEKKLNDIISQRGKKGTDKEKQIEDLRKLYKQTGQKEQQIEINFHLVCAWFDIVSPGTTMYMPAGAWKHAYKEIVRVLNALLERPNYVLQESDQQISEESNKKYDNSEIVKIPVQGSLLGMVERLHDELILALQFVDAKKDEFFQRLADEVLCSDCLERIYFHYASRGMLKHCSRIALQLMKLLHFRKQEDHSKALQKQRQLTSDKVKNTKVKYEETEEDDLLFARGRKKKEYSIGEDLSETMGRFLSVVMKHGEEKSKISALLYYIIHLAQHKKYIQARDVLLQTHINELVMQTNNVAFQIQYNRALALMGIAAFRCGFYKDVHTCLNELTAKQDKIRELIAQAVPQRDRNMERKAEQERQDKLKLVPAHQFINVDTIETCHYIASMILEIPQWASCPYETKRKYLSKSLNKLLNQYYQQVFVGPPENMRDFVYGACKALSAGNWKQCNDYVMSMGGWNAMPGAPEVKEMITNRIKEEAMRCFLLQHASFYDSLSEARLVEQFELKPAKIQSVVAKMLFSEEISGSWDQPSQCLRVNRNHVSKLQYLAQKVADKASAHLEYNERSVESRAAGWTVQPQSSWGRGGRGGRGGGGGGGRGNRSSDWSTSSSWGARRR